MLKKATATSAGVLSNSCVICELKNMCQDYLQKLTTEFWLWLHWQDPIFIVSAHAIKLAGLLRRALRDESPVLKSFWDVKFQGVICTSWEGLCCLWGSRVFVMTSRHFLCLLPRTYAQKCKYWTTQSCIPECCCHGMDPHCPCELVLLLAQSSALSHSQAAPNEEILHYLDQVE